MMSACQSRPSSTAAQQPLAKVYDRTLYLDDLDGMLPDVGTPEDSALIIDAYVQRWIREALLLQEAERKLSPDLNIDELVRDYRASLLLNSYERTLVETVMDSTVSQQELEAFYEKNKEQYQLETPIIRCNFIKVSLPVPRGDKLREWWNSDRPADRADLIKYCNQYADTHVLQDSAWYKVEEIAAAMPSGTLTTKNVRAKLDFSQRDGQFQYYLKVFELKQRKDIAPLSFIEDQARRFILHQRQKKMLEEKKEEMYEREIQQENIKIYEY